MVYPGATCSFHSEPFNTLRHLTCGPLACVFCSKSCTSLGGDKTNPSEKQLTAATICMLQWRAPRHCGKSHAPLIMGCGRWYGLKFLAKIPKSSRQRILSLMITYESIYVVRNGTSLVLLENQEQMQMNLSNFKILPFSIKHHPETIVQWGIFLIYGTTQWGYLILGAWGKMISTVHDHVCFGPTKILSPIAFFSLLWDPGPVRFLCHLWLPGIIWWP